MADRQSLYHQSTQNDVNALEKRLRHVRENPLQRERCCKRYQSAPFHEPGDQNPDCVSLATGTERGLII